MSVTLSQLAIETSRRLGDASEVLWNGTELRTYIQQGYDRLCQLTLCLWEMDALPDYDYAFTHTVPFEATLLEGISGAPVNRCCQFTALFERDLISNAEGPANHNFHWEYLDGYVDEVTTVTVAATDELPENLYRIERSTWNTRRIDAAVRRDFGDDSRYELNTGMVLAYMREGDGLNELRKWRVPSTPYVPYEFDADSDDFGIIRFMGEIDDSIPSEPYGDLVSIDGQESFGGSYGIIGPVIKEANSVRLQFSRRADALEFNDDVFMIPDRYTQYVRFYAMARALERDGDGQDFALSEHYDSRFLAGVERMKKRKAAMQSQRISVLGGGRDRLRRMPLAKLPWHYPVTR